jgi:hypothetical protein
MTTIFEIDITSDLQEEISYWNKRYQRYIQELNELNINYKIDMTSEFEEELQEELSYLKGVLEELGHEEDELNFNYANLSWVELERLDEIPNVDGPEIQSKIDNIIAILEAIENQKKKRFAQLKFEVEEQSLRMMYHPTRVARLLDAGLVSFEEEGSFDNL